MPETWVKLLITYGPFALLVFFVFIIEGRARSQRSQGPTSERIYAATWLAIFAICVVIVMAWWQVNLVDHEYRISGRLTGLQANWSFSSPFDQMYIRRILESSTKSDFEWRIYSVSRLPDGSNVRLLLDRSTEDHENLSEYDLPINTDFYTPGTTVSLKYLPQPNAILLEYGAKRMTLAEVAPEDMARSFTRGLLTTVHAQKRPSLDGMAQKLESDDALVRLIARSELAKIGPTALPFVQEILADAKSSYRLQLGVISALNKMPDISGNSLAPYANCTISRLAQTEDSALRAEATRFLTSHPDIVLSPGCSGPKIEKPAGSSQALAPVRPSVSLPPKPVDCKPWRLEDNESISFSLGTEKLWVYLASQSPSTPDTADIYVLNSSIWPKAGQIKKSDFLAQVQQIKPTDYLEQKLTNHQSVTTTLGSHHFTLWVETHYVRSFALVKLCPAP